MSDSFETVGHFEELIDERTSRFLGSRPFTQDSRTPRLHGVAGQITLSLTAPVTLTRGGEKCTYGATARKPLRVVTRVYPLCGRRKWKHPLDPQ